MERWATQIQKCVTWIEERNPGFPIWKKIGYWRRRGVGTKWILAEVEEIADALQSECKKAEPEFIRVGRDLEELFHVSQNMSEDVEKAVRGTSEEDTNHGLSGVRSKSMNALSRLEKSRGAMESGMNRISNVIDCLNALHDTCGVIERVAMVLRVVGLNMGVECSRSHDSMNLFHVVSQETKQLSEKIIHIATEIKEVTFSALAGQLLVKKEVSSVGENLGILSREASKAMNKSIQKVEELVTFSLGTLQDAESRSSEIARGISNVVMVMQSHDSITQRIEHMGKSLREIRTVLHSDPSEKRRNQNRRERMASVHSILILQLSQLKEIISEIEKSYQDGKESFGAIYVELKELVQRLSGMNEWDRNGNIPYGKESEDPFVSLGSAFQGLNTILKQGHELVERVTTTAKDAAVTTQRLGKYTEEVRKISIDTHIMALNAIVKAAHLGEKGRTLEVLAQEVRKLSDQSEKFVEAVQVILEKTRESSMELKELVEETFADDSSKGEGAGSMDELIQQISLSAQKFKRDSGNIFDCAENVKNGFRQRKSSLEFLPSLGIALGRQLKRIHDLEKALEHWKGGAEEVCDENTAKLAQRYTMKKERDIHGQIMGCNSISNERERSIGTWGQEDFYELKELHPDGSEREQQEEDLGTNVELF